MHSLLLVRRGLDSTALFLQGAPTSELDAIREDLDTNSEFAETHTPQGMAATLLALLKSLADPVVPVEYHPPADLEPGFTPQWSSKLLDQLPTLSHNIIVYLVAFLREVLAHSANNDSTPELLGE
jgi:hypothetical protein